jgi:hypothetical protein
MSTARVLVAGATGPPAVRLEVRTPPGAHILVPMFRRPR